MAPESLSNSSAPESEEQTSNGDFSTSYNNESNPNDTLSTPNGDFSTSYNNESNPNDTLSTPNGDELVLNGNEAMLGGNEPMSGLYGSDFASADSTTNRGLFGNNEQREQWSERVGGEPEILKDREKLAYQLVDGEIFKKAKLDICYLMQDAKKLEQAGRSVYDVDTALHSGMNKGGFFYFFGKTAEGDGSTAEDEVLSRSDWATSGSKRQDALRTRTKLVDIVDKKSPKQYIDQISRAVQTLEPSLKQFMGEKCPQKYIDLLLEIQGINIPSASDFIDNLISNMDWMPRVAYSDQPPELAHYRESPLVRRTEKVYGPQHARSLKNDKNVLISDVVGLICVKFMLDRTTDASTQPQDAESELGADLEKYCNQLQARCSQFKNRLKGIVKDMPTLSDNFPLSVETSPDPNWESCSSWISNRGWERSTDAKPESEYFTRQELDSLASPGELPDVLGYDDVKRINARLIYYFAAKMRALYQQYGRSDDHDVKQEVIELSEINDSLQAGIVLRPDERKDNQLVFIDGVPMVLSEYWAPHSVENSIKERLKNIRRADTARSIRGEKWLKSEDALTLALEHEDAFFDREFPDVKQLSSDTAKLCPEFKQRYTALVRQMQSYIRQTTHRDPISEVREFDFTDFPWRTTEQKDEDGNVVVKEGFIDLAREVVDMVPGDLQSHLDQATQQALQPLLGVKKIQMLSYAKNDEVRSAFALATRILIVASTLKREIDDIDRILRQIEAKAAELTRSNRFPNNWLSKLGVVKTPAEIDYEADLLKTQLNEDGRSAVRIIQSQIEQNPTIFESRR